MKVTSRSTRPAPLAEPRYVLARHDRLTAAHAHAAFRELFHNDWLTALERLRRAVEVLRANAHICTCGKPACPGITSMPAVLEMLTRAAHMVAFVADSWRVLEPTWRPQLNWTWRERLLVRFAATYALARAQAADEPEGAEKDRLNGLLCDVVRLIMRGERGARDA